MATIVLTRHGRVEGITPAPFRGRFPLFLNSSGKEKAVATAWRIANTWRPAIVITSPPERCVSTGATIAQACGGQTSVDHDLIDLDYGEWEWLTYEIVEKWPHEFARRRTTPHLLRFPSGESLQDVVLRSANVFRWVIEQYQNETIVLVGHDSVNRVLLLQLLDQSLSAYWRLRQDRCCINLIEFENDLIWIAAINDTQHLRALEGNPQAGLT